MIHYRPEFHRYGFGVAPTWGADRERIDLAADPWRPSDPTARGVLEDTELYAVGTGPDWSEVEDWEDAMPCRPTLRPVRGEWESYGPEPLGQDGDEPPAPDPARLARAREMAGEQERERRAAKRAQRAAEGRLEATRQAAVAVKEVPVVDRSVWPTWTGTQTGRFAPRNPPLEQPEPRRWSGLANQWAQMCWACGELVPVGAGTFRAIAPGEWEASHWACR